MKVEYLDEGNERYGLKFRRDELDPLPSFSCDENGEVFIGFPDDDTAMQARDALDRRYPCDARRQLADEITGRLKEGRKSILGRIRSLEQDGKDTDEEETRLYAFDDVFELLNDLL